MLGVVLYFWGAWKSYGYAMFSRKFVRARATVGERRGAVSINRAGAREREWKAAEWGAGGTRALRTERERARDWLHALGRVHEYNAWRVLVVQLLVHYVLNPDSYYLSYIRAVLLLKRPRVARTMFMHAHRLNNFEGGVVSARASSFWYYNNYNDQTEVV